WKAQPLVPPLIHCSDHVLYFQHIENEDRKLVCSAPTHVTRVADGGNQALSHLAEQLVCGMASECVVNHPEPLRLRDHESERLLRASSATDTLCETFLKECTVREPRERIVVSQ